MKRIHLLLLALCLCIGAQAQSENSKFKFDKSKLEFGGGFGFSFGSSKYNGNSTGIQISPQVGYRFSGKFSAGAGISYIHKSWSKYDYSENYGGLTLYARFSPFQHFFLSAEPQLYYAWGENFDNRFVPCVLLGGGVIIPVGTKGGVLISLSYDVVQNDYSPYYDRAIYSVGYTFRF